MNFVYNDYDGYFDNLVTDIPLQNKKNAFIIKNIKKLIDEYFIIANTEEVQRIRKEDIIVEIAQNIETLYRNSNLDHLVETIASTVCLILTKKDKTVTPRWIYEVLQKNFKNRYVSYSGADKRNDIYAKRNIVYREICQQLASVPEKLDDCFRVIEPSKRDEIAEHINKIEYVLNNLRARIDEEERTVQLGNIPANSSYHHGVNMTVPQEDTSSIITTPPSSASGVNTNPELESETNTTNNASQTTGNVDSDKDKDKDNYPKSHKSRYYEALGIYINVLEKIRDNVLRFPPSPKLDRLLHDSLELEIELLMPAVDMKYKRSIPQLDETVRHANIQSLGGASSVMKEKMLIKDSNGDIIDPYDPNRRFSEKFHKLAPEQIEIRKGYISNIRKKMASYCPHIYYNILWYEGSDIYEHLLAMGKFSRANIKKNGV